MVKFWFWVYSYAALAVLPYTEQEFNNLWPLIASEMSTSSFNRFYPKKQYIPYSALRQESAPENTTETTLSTTSEQPSPEHQPSEHPSPEQQPSEHPSPDHQPPASSDATERTKTMPVATITRKILNCGCGNLYDPVCASDHRSYFNPCRMKCVNMELIVLYLGQCLPFK